jgi:hypothetical protein
LQEILIVIKFAPGEFEFLQVPTGTIVFWSTAAAATAAWMAWLAWTKGEVRPQAPAARTIAQRLDAEEAEGREKSKSQ